MAHQLQRISFDQFERELRHVFERVRVSKEPILIDQDGETFRVAIDEPGDIWQGYDPDEAERALRAAQGIFAGIDREQFLAEMHELREQGPDRLG